MIAMRPRHRHQEAPSGNSSLSPPVAPHGISPLQSLADRKACTCGGGCQRCTASSGEPLPEAVRARAEARQGTDFSLVRIHPEAEEITTPLRARAVTYGQNIYFHPREYQPGTARGDALIAHELAHTRQARHSGGSALNGRVSEPGDTVETNADALARGETRHVIAAPAGAALRSPFDHETADERERRERMLTSIANATERLIRMLSSRGLLQNIEVPVTRSGVQGIIYFAHTAGTADERFISYPDRDARIRRIIASLIAMGMLYRSAPIPGNFPAPTYDATTGDYESRVSYTTATGPVDSTFGGSDRNWVDLQGAYERYRISHGQISEEYDADWHYLNPRNIIVPGAAVGAPQPRHGQAIGANLVVPDADRQPLRYWLHTPTEPVPRGSIIVEVWQDSFGYYYMHRSRRIDIPSPWRRPRPRDDSR